VRAKRQKLADTRQLLDIAESLNAELESFFLLETASVDLLPRVEAPPEVLRQTSEAAVEVPPEVLRRTLEAAVEAPPEVLRRTLEAAVEAPAAFHNTDDTISRRATMKPVTKLDILVAIYLQSNNFTQDVERRRVKDVLDRDSNGSTLRYLCHNPKVPGSYPLYLEKVDSEGNRLPTTASKNYYMRFTDRGRAWVQARF
jgi:hypothetical protein